MITRNLLQLTYFSNKRVAFAHKLTVRDALNAALDEELERDDKVFLIGEEVAQYDGAYKVSKGLWKKYGSRRVVDTPISEAGFTGLAIGAALNGLRPVCEFMSWNFGLQGLDQIMNSAAKFLYMSSGSFAVPIVFRGPNGPSIAVGAQHSTCMSAILSCNPGLKVVSPYSSEDAKGLLKTAIRDTDPVCVLENELLYGEAFDVSDQVMSKDFTIPLGKAKIEKPGKDITIVCYSINVKHALLAGKQLSEQGIDCEIINLRSIRPLDLPTVINSVKKTHYLVTMDTSWAHCGVCENLVSRLMNTDAFYYLDGAPARISMADIPMSYAQIHETSSVPKPTDVEFVVKKVLNKN